VERQQMPIPGLVPYDKFVDENFKNAKYPDRPLCKRTRQNYKKIYGFRVRKVGHSEFIDPLEAAEDIRLGPIDKRKPEPAGRGRPRREAAE
jgi:hypothetical protein